MSLGDLFSKMIASLRYMNPAGKDGILRRIGRRVIGRGDKAGDDLPEHSSDVRDRFFHPRYAGRIGEPHGIGTAGKHLWGPDMKIFVKVEGDQVADISFQTRGCPASIASCDCLCELAKDTTPEAASAIEPEKLSRTLGGLPEEKDHCPKMAVAALRNALRSARKEIS